MRYLALPLTVLITGCAYNPLFPDLRTPEGRAREIDPMCKHVSESGAAPPIASSLIEGVEPAYNYVQSGNDRAVRLRGARLRLRPEADTSVEKLQRRLECHEARVTEDGVAAVDDPFALAGTWLDIKADSTGDGFVVAVLVDDHDKALEVLGRARRFAASQGSN
jgi:hypothetical protein